MRRYVADGNPPRADGWRSSLLFCERAPTRAGAARAEEKAVDLERLLGVAGTARVAKVVDELVERL